MAHLPLLSPTESGASGRPPADSPTASSQAIQQSSAAFLLKTLHDALSSGTHTPDAIFRAAADSARILTGAHGIAIALRTNGLVICRARSGDIAPELGVALSADSGLSGECLRTSIPLLCDDTQSDDRVEPEVCRLLGIRSIAAVPVRYNVITVGILEAFSGNASAFTHEQIDWLKDLARIVEDAYEQEFKAKYGQTKAAPAPAANAILAPTRSLPTRTSTFSVVHDLKSTSRIWHAARKFRPNVGVLAGILALALLSAVIWASWRESADESAASQQPAKPYAAPIPTPSSDAPEPKPSPTFLNDRSLNDRALAGRALTDGSSKTRAEGSPAGNVVRSAASTEKLPAPSPGIQPGTGSSRSTFMPRRPANSSAGSSSRGSEVVPSTVEAPPTVVLATADRPEKNDSLTSVISTAPGVPTLDVRVSQGVTQANLIHKVTPQYPPEALAKRLEGSVNLTASIAEDGTVNGVQIVRGQPVLAASAVAAVRQWRYTPTFLNGSPTPVQREITIVFKLP